MAAAPRVVQVVRDADLPVVDDALPRTPVDHEAVVELADRWGVGSSVTRLVTALSL